MPFNILIADGDIPQSKILWKTIQHMGHKVTFAQSLPEATNIVMGQREGGMDLLLLDASLLGIAVTGTICAIKQKQPRLQMMIVANNDDAALALCSVNRPTFIETTGNFRRMAEIEADVIKSALEYYEWHISEVARRLGIGRSTLYRKMDELHINIPRDKHEMT